MIRFFILACISFISGAATIHAQQVLKLYEGKPKGSESWTWNEQTSTNNQFKTEVVYNVSEPTITAYLPPKEAANGTAIIVAPGGAFHTLSINSEGVDVAKWLNSKGIAAFVLKYRVVHSLTDDPVKELMPKMQDFKKLDEENAPVVPLAMADGLTAVRYVRSHAKDFNIDPKKIGFMGFSAGGTLTMSVVYNATDTNRPNFVAPIYAYEPAVIGSAIPTAKNRSKAPRSMGKSVSFATTATIFAPLRMKIRWSDAPTAQAVSAGRLGKVASWLVRKEAA